MIHNSFTLGSLKSWSIYMYMSDIKLVLCLQGNPQNIEWFNDDNLQKQVYDVGNVRFTFNEENFYKLAIILWQKRIELDTIYTEYILKPV